MLVTYTKMEISMVSPQSTGMRQGNDVGFTERSYLKLIPDFRRS